MVQLITGKSGNGKTKLILEKANKKIGEAQGNLVFLDKDSKNMYDLNNRVRLVNLKEFKLSGKDELIGFVYGIISSDSDIEVIYFDNFLKLASLGEEDFVPAIKKLNEIEKIFGVEFVVSANVSDVGEELKAQVIASL